PSWVETPQQRRRRPRDCSLQNASTRLQQPASDRGRTLANPSFELVGTQTIVILKRLVNPGVRGKFVYIIVGRRLGMPFPPEHRATQLGDFGELFLQMLAHPIECQASVD